MALPLPTNVVAGATTGHAAHHNDAHAVVNVVIRAAPFAVVYPGSTTEARKSSDGSVISSDTNPTTVINAAITAACAVTNGGRVMLADGLFPDLPSKILIQGAGGVVLAGQGGSKDRPAGDLGVGTVLKAASSFTDAQMIEVGASGSSGHAGGVIIQDLTLDVNTKSIHGVKGFNAQDLKLWRLQLLGPGQATANKRAIFLQSDQATNGGSGADPDIVECWARNWDSFLYAGSINGTDGETVTTTGGTDGKVWGCKAWSCKRHVIVHHGGWAFNNCHLVGNTTTDFHFWSDSQCRVENCYLDSAKAGGFCLELSTGSVASNVTGCHFLTGGDNTTLGVKWTAQRNRCGENTFATQGAPFLKFTNSGNGGQIVNNTGTGPATNNDILHTSAAAQITQPAVQTPTTTSYYAGNTLV